MVPQAHGEEAAVTVLTKACQRVGCLSMSFFSFLLDVMKEVLQISLRALSIYDYFHVYLFISTIWYHGAKNVIVISGYTWKKGSNLQDTNMPP